MSGERVHRRVRVATASPAALDAGIAALAGPGALTQVLPGLRSKASGHVSMVLVGPEGADVTWSGRATVDVVPGGADVRLEPATPISPSIMLRARAEDSGAYVSVDAEVVGADGGFLPAAWSRSLEAIARLLAADLAAGPVTEDAAGGSGAPSTEHTSTLRSSTAATGPRSGDPLDLARSLLPKDPRVAVAAAAIAVVAVGWWLGSRRGRR